MSGRALNCPDCGRFCSESWSRHWSTQDGTIYGWGGVCKVHGEWRDGT